MVAELGGIWGASLAEGRCSESPRLFAEERRGRWSRNIALSRDSLL